MSIGAKQSRHQPCKWNRLKTVSLSGYRRICLQGGRHILLLATDFPSGIRQTRTCTKLPRRAVKMRRKKWISNYLEWYQNNLKKNSRTMDFVPKTTTSWQQLFESTRHQHSYKVLQVYAKASRWAYSTLKQRYLLKTFNFWFWCRRL